MKPIKSTVLLLISVSLPFFFLLTAIRGLFTPIYPQLEYQMPGFPQDEFGFTNDERLHFALIAVDYITRSSTPLSSLSDQQFKDGTPLYRERELSHMVDVKVVFQNAVLAHRLFLVFYIVIGIIAAMRKDLTKFGLAIRRGGWYTIGLTGCILAAVAISFNALFTAFHSLFFEGDSWIFLWSDTLIRLFPPRFWQDAFIAVGAITLILAGVAILGGGRLAARSFSQVNPP